MRIAVLTTETPHHVHFVRALAGEWLDLRVFCETRRAPAPFATAHPFEEERDRFEWTAWFSGTPRTLADFAETETVESMNDPAAVRRLMQMQPDAIVVFGTGKLAPPVIAVRPDAIFNLHGGDPEDYRGLDSHLWAIYHRDFAGLVTTLHRLNEDLDDGAVVLQGAIPLRRNMGLHELRHANTELCLALARGALILYQRTGTLAARPQRRRGRYYSFMPAAMKDLCVRIFRRHTGTISA